MRRALAVVLLLCAACVGQSTPSPSPSGTGAQVAGGPDMTDVLARTELPPADAFALVRRIKGLDGTPGPWEPVRTTVPDRQVGETDTFYFYDQRTKTNEKLDAVIRYRTDHAYWYVESSLRPDPARLAQSGLDFESKVYPVDHRAFGSEWTPGIDNDPRITILLARIPDVGGYFSAADEYPKWVNPFSNEREMIYINSDSAQPGSAGLLSTLAHEFAHMILFASRKNSVVWFNEGQAQYAEQVNGFTPGGTIAAFLRAPDTQLTDWRDTASDAAPNYGQAFLIVDYLAQRFGAADLVKTLVSRSVDTPADVEAVLRARGGPSFEDAYLDFVASVGLIDQAAARDPYRFTDLRLPALRATRERALQSGEVRPASVHQYALKYYELPPGKVSIDFAGVTSVRLLPTDPHGGQWVWWSNRGDGADTRLTRTVDLRSTAAATLTYWAWYEIESDFDYAYVEASVDGGKTWRTLRATASTDTDPNGANLGNGVTGKSGGGTTPRWTEEKVDLTPFAHEQIQLRFEYVTDQALNKDGLAIDDLAIPEIGWRDDAESDGDWRAEGFVRSSNVVRERFALEALTLGDAPAVQRITVGADGKAHADLDVPDRGALLAVTAFAPATTQAGTFTITVTKR